MILRNIILFAIVLISPLFLFGQSVVEFPSDSALEKVAEAPPQQQYYIVHNINFSGNKRTKSKIVKREISVQTGIAYTADELAKQLRLTREQLMNTTLFVDVIVDTTYLDVNDLDVQITVKERWYLWPSPYFRVVDRNWNVWIKEYGASLSRADIGLKIAHDNATGVNDKLNMWAIGGYTQRLSFNYFKPYFDKKLRFGYNVAFAYSRTRELNYITDRNKQVFLTTPHFSRKYIRGEAGVSYRKGSNLRMQLKTSYNYEKVDTQVVNLNPNYFGNGREKAHYVDVTFNTQYYNVDYIPYPLRGWYVDGFMITRLSDVRKMSMVQIGGKFFGTWEVMHKTYLAFQASGLVRLPSDVAYFNSRLLGYGDNYMQGLEYYVADGTAGGMVRATLRHKFWEFTWHNKLFKTKTHNEIPFRFFVKVFGNAGYVYSKFPGNSFMNNKLLKTAGFGLDIVTVYDWAIKLDFTFNQFDRGGQLYLHTQSDF